MLDIHAVNFFGPPAANRKYETEIQVSQKYFSSKQFDGFDFGLTNQTTFFDKTIKEGTTDANGNAQLEYEVPTIYSNMGALQASFYTTVFDETGRPVSRLANTSIYTQSAFFGIKQDWSYYYPLNQPVKFQLAAANKDGNGISCNMQTFR
jgi:uncharacterized protein YfaS (alpha-2-macroglobulin family)